jgi:site-specific DNA recombinase
MTPRSAVLYCRVSSKEQEKEGFSIAAQERLLNKYANEKGFRVLSKYVDVETAKRAGRTGFVEMVTTLRRNQQCRIVIVEKTDRLYRNFKDYVTLDEIKDLEIHFVKEGAILSPDSRSSEKFIHGIKVLMAKNFIDNLSEETRKGMTEKAEQGMWPSYAPIGYLNAEGPSGKRVIVPDPDLAPLVTRLYELCATGQYSTKELASLAREEHLTRGKPLATSTADKILRNRAYSGEFEWRGVRHVATYEPIVSSDLWHAAQAALDRRLGTRAKKTGHCFPFSGMLTCGSCGFAMVGELKKGKYVYYHCSGARGKCPQPYARQEAIEEAYKTALQQISIDAEVLEWISTALRQSHGDQKQFRDEAVENLKREHLRLQGRIDAMYEDRLDGRIDLAFFDRKSREYRDRQSQILAEIDQHGAADCQYTDAGIRLLELARNMHRLFAQQPAAEKRRLLDFVVPNSIWSNGKVIPAWRQPFDMIALANQSNTSTDVPSCPEKEQNTNWLPDMDSNHDSPAQIPLMEPTSETRRTDLPSCPLPIAPCTADCKYGKVIHFRGEENTRTLLQGF